MALKVEPPELARLLDFAERPRAADWSMRAALTRYGQPQPVRASEIIELLRRVESAAGRQAKLLERNGHALWDSLQTGANEPVDGIVGLLQAIVELDRLGDVLARWAVDRGGDPPDAAVDAVIADVAPRLDELGIPREERPRPPGGRR